MSLAEEEILDEGLYEHYAFTADPGQEQMRIDKWLMHKIANASRSKIQAGIESGAVVVNDKPTKSNYKVKPNDHVRVLLPTAPRDTEVYPENIPINIVYEDDYLLVVNKVAGMVVHPGHNNFSGTLVGLPPLKRVNMKHKNTPSKSDGIRSQAKKVGSINKSNTCAPKKPHVKEI